jgi:hypothetical protein
LSAFVFEHIVYKPNYWYVRCNTEDEYSSRIKKKEKKKRITFTQIEHHTMKITKREKKKTAITSTKIDTLLQLNEIWNRTKKTKPSDIVQKVNVYILFSSSNEQI